LFLKRRASVFLLYFRQVYPGTYEIEVWDGANDPIAIGVKITGASPRLVTPFPKG
jgi:hypothetical protein